MIDLIFLFTALALGFKHSYDADHLLAVSNLLTKTKSLKSSVKMGVSWAAGHMITAALVTIVLFIFRDSVLKAVLANFEIIVAAMLIAIGVWSIIKSRIFHSHRHEHIEEKHAHAHMHIKNKENEHIHAHMFGIGVVQGLASNDELLILFTLSLGVVSLADILIGVAVFSLGVVFGMIIFSLFFIYPILKINSERLQQIVNFGVGAISVVYGIAILQGIVFGVAI